MYMGSVHMNKEAQFMRSNKTLRLLLYLAVIAISVLLIGGCTPNIEKLQNKQDVESLIKALNYEPDIKIRDNAVAALGEIGDKRAMEPLIEVLKDEDEEVPSWVLDALIKIGEPSVEPLIEVALKDEKVRGWVVDFIWAAKD